MLLQLLVGNMNLCRLNGINVPKADTMNLNFTAYVSNYNVLSRALCKQGLIDGRKKRKV